MEILGRNDALWNSTVVLVIISRQWGRTLLSGKNLKSIH